MKPLSTVKVACAAAAFLFISTSFKPAPAKAPEPVKQGNVNYYWYVDNGTEYEGWNTTETEIGIMEVEYDVYVDQDPLNGTLVASGYAYKGYPHEIYASVFLYAH